MSKIIVCIGFIVSCGMIFGQSDLIFLDSGDTLLCKRIKEGRMKISRDGKTSKHKTISCIGGTQEDEKPYLDCEVKSFRAKGLIYVRSQFYSLFSRKPKYRYDVYY